MSRAYQISDFLQSDTHSLLQSHLQTLIPDLVQEFPFLSSRRIADLYWPEQRIVFEIQCSPISPEEALQRARDYAQEGCALVWLLDERRFNQRAVRLAGVGRRYFFSPPTLLVYDQHELAAGGKRIARGPKLPVDLSLPLRGDGELYFSGDLRDRTSRFPLYAESIRSYEKTLLSSRRRPLAPRLTEWLWRGWELLLRFLFPSVLQR